MGAGWGQGDRMAHGTRRSTGRAAHLHEPARGHAVCLLTARARVRVRVRVGVRVGVRVRATARV